MAQLGVEAFSCRKRAYGVIWNFSMGLKNETIVR